ncbi:MAG: hypothetical protein LUH05_07415 [Candidatus Gastranaerophilales bacterium]|nr:hypothetical protein [Candidatus Gastranaerophilales bacterium]
MNVLNTVSKPGINYNNYDKDKNRKTVKAASIAGSAIGIAGAVAGVYAMAKKGNPAVSMKNFAYSEKDALMIGAGSVLGGLTGGLIADKNKENTKPKLREASQQFLGNMACPLGLLAASNKLLEKTNFKLPKINSASKPAKIANGVLNVLPKAAVTIGSLVGGMEIGNKIMNKVNDKVFKEEVKHDVKPEDFLVHTDDLCLAASMLLKDAKSVTTVTSKVLPASFIVAGAKTGIQEKSIDQNPEKV